METSTRQFINKEVNVTAVYFSGKHSFKSFPRRIAYDNQEVTFLRSGLRYLVQKGQGFIQLFDMTDGQRDYRLKFDPAALTWTLVRVADAPRPTY